MIDTISKNKCELAKINSNTYSWIARQLQVGCALAFLLARSDFKPETSFGFLSPDYTGQST